MAECAAGSQYGKDGPFGFKDVVVLELFFHVFTGVYLILSDISVRVDDWFFSFFFYRYRERHRFRRIGVIGRHSRHCHRSRAEGGHRVGGSLFSVRIAASLYAVGHADYAGLTVRPGESLFCSVGRRNAKVELYRIVLLQLIMLLRRSGGQKRLFIAKFYFNLRAYGRRSVADDREGSLSGFLRHYAVVICGLIPGNILVVRNPAHALIGSVGRQDFHFIPVALLSVRCQPDVLSAKTVPHVDVENFRTGDSDAGYGDFHMYGLERRRNTLVFFERYGINITFPVGGSVLRPDAKPVRGRRNTPISRN